MTFCFIVCVRWEMGTFWNCVLEPFDIRNKIHHIFCSQGLYAAAVNEKYGNVFLLWQEGSRSWCKELICILWVAPSIGNQHTMPILHSDSKLWWHLLLQAVLQCLPKGKKQQEKRMVRKTDLFSQKKSLRFEYLCMYIVVSHVTTSISKNKVSWILEFHSRI